MSRAIFNKSGLRYHLNAARLIQQENKISIEPDWENILFEARVAITDNPRFNNWYGTLPSLVRQLLDEILDHEVTPAIICLAQECSEEDWEKHMFIQALGNGNPSPTAANDLTDVVLGLVPWSLG